MTPGQHLHAIMVAFFNGGGWADAPEWDDFDEAGHAEWEEMARGIGRNLRLARAAPELLEALTAIREAWEQDDPTDHLIRASQSAIAKASPSPGGG